MFNLVIFKLNSSHDALCTFDINRTIIECNKFEIHDFGAALINRGIIIKTSGGRNQTKFMLPNKAQHDLLHKSCLTSVNKW